MRRIEKKLRRNWLVIGAKSLKTPLRFEVHNSLNEILRFDVKTWARFIRRAAAVPNQIGRIKFGSSTVAARRMNRVN